MRLSPLQADNGVRPRTDGLSPDVPRPRFRGIEARHPWTPRGGADPATVRLWHLPACAVALELPAGGVQRPVDLALEGSQPLGEHLHVLAQKAPECIAALRPVLCIK